MASIAAGGIGAPMTSRDFCYWLQGYFESITASPIMGDKQITHIKQHLTLVFEHEIDPSAGFAEQQAGMYQIHHTDVDTEPEMAYQLRQATVADSPH